MDGKTGCPTLDSRSSGSHYELYIIYEKFSYFFLL